MMKTTTVLMLVVIAVTAMACQGSYPTTAASKRPEAAASAPKQVRVVPAVQGKLSRTVAVTGTLAAEEQVVLSMKVPGRLSEIFVDLGSRVRKGQPIARLDPTDFRLRVEQAKTALQQARVRLGLPPDGTDDRVDPEQTALVRQARAMLNDARLAQERRATLWEQQLVPRAELDAGMAALQVAEGRYQDAIEEVRNRQAILAQRRSELEIARQQLADTVLHAPMDSAVRERQASAGEYLAVGAPVVTLVRIHPLRLRLPVPEREASGVRVGQTVRVTVEGDATVYTGRVVRLSPAIKEESRTRMIEAEVSNERGLLPPGAFAKAEVLTETPQPVVFVPASSIVTFAGIEKVISVRDGRVVEKRVQTGRREGDRVEIVKGLSAGEPVVVEPGNLISGQPATIIK